MLPVDPERRRVRGEVECLPMPLVHRLADHGRRLPARVGHETRAVAGQRHVEARRHQLESGSHRRRRRTNGGRIEGCIPADDVLAQRHHEFRFDGGRMRREYRYLGTVLVVMTGEQRSMEGAVETERGERGIERRAELDADARGVGQCVQRRLKSVGVLDGRCRSVDGHA